MESKYQPAGCEHKLPNGLSAWVFQSEESGSGPEMYFDVHVCVCKLCGTVRVGGFRQDKQGKLNKFSEEIDLHAAEAIDAIVKYANYIHGEEVWGRLKAQPGAMWVKAKERLPGIDIKVKWRFNDEEKFVEVYKMLAWHPVSLPQWEWYDESAVGREDAVEFAEWLNSNFVSIENKEGEAVYVEYSPQEYDKKQQFKIGALYELFKQQKQ